jgi:hypothetical protein
MPSADVARASERRPGPTDPEWYKDGIIYELHLLAGRAVREPATCSGGNA